MHNSMFWQGKKVFITGHTGFKGSWLTLCLQELGAQVFGFALPPTSPSLFEQARIEPTLSASIFEDIRNYQALHQAIKQYQPDIVFHLAAQPLVRYSYKEPVETFGSNTLGTVHMLEAIRHNDSVSAAVFVTTDKVYENREWIWGYRENDRLGGTDPYSASKAAAELAILSYRQSFFSSPSSCRLASVRAGNVIGGGDWSQDRIIPDTIRALIDNQTLHLRFPDAVRPWQYVLEPLFGYLQLAERLCSPATGKNFVGAWNFAPREDRPMRVRDIVQSVEVLWHGTSGTLSLAIDDTYKPKETTYLRLDYSKAREYLGWQPVVSIQEALSSTVEWYKAASLGKNIRAITLHQVALYKQRQQTQTLSAPS